MKPPSALGSDGDDRTLADVRHLDGRLADAIRPRLTHTERGFYECRGSSVRLNRVENPWELLSDETRQ
jgi:hypothetical protein